MCPNDESHSHKVSWIYYVILLLFVLFLLFFSSFSYNSESNLSLNQAPVAYKGRYRPLEVYSQLLLEEAYHAEELNAEMRSVLSNQESPVEILLRLHFLSHGDERENEKLLLAVQQHGEEGLSKKNLSMLVEERIPLSQRITEVDSILKMLPSIKGDGLWLPLKALKLQVYDFDKMELVPIGNFTLYSDEIFHQLQKSYLELEKSYLENSQDAIRKYSDDFAAHLFEGYQTLAGLPYLESFGKQLNYPTINQLYAEILCYRYPWTVFLIIFYSVALLMLLFSVWKKSLKNWGFALVLGAFILHSIILAMRCYILQRPPVSNMFETVIYVPWVAVAASLVLFSIFRNTILITSSCLVTIGLLSVLVVTNMDRSLENVQAVLNSQYWLIIHVLLVVGSYGIFALSSVLGHISLLLTSFSKVMTPRLAKVHEFVLQTMYVGVAMLIAGTILGGVWAAESWGRFWDWDPKESWAFISICTYLIVIHAYRYKHINNFGLAVGAILGFLSISFTWYGVNYILGTGLHSYGFGSGGELFYYGFCLAELLFVIGMLVFNKKSHRLHGFRG